MDVSKRIQSVTDAKLSKLMTLEPEFENAHAKAIAQRDAMQKAMDCLRELLFSSQ